jgi:hypothetical protein
MTSSLESSSSHRYLPERLTLSPQSMLKPSTLVKTTGFYL